MKRIAITFIFLIILITLTSANEFGYNNLDKPTLSKTVVNYTQVNVNSSEYWGTHYYTDYDLLVPYTGATQNVNLGTNSFNASDITIVAKDSTKPSILDSLPGSSSRVFIIDNLYETSGKIYFNIGGAHTSAQNKMFITTEKVSVNNFNNDVDFSVSGSNTDDIFFIDASSEFIRLNVNTYVPDNKGLYFGSGNDARILYNATDFVFTPNLVGTGKFIINGSTYSTENITAQYFIGDGSQLTGISGDGYWGSNGTNIYNDTIIALGIGTATPTDELHLQGDGYRMVVKDSAGNIATYLGDNNGGFINIYDNNGVLKNRITGDGGVNYFTAGNVGIGTASPTYELEVKSNNPNIGLYETDTSKSWRTQVSGSNFYITETGVGNSLTIAPGGDATFSASVIADALQTNQHIYHQGDTDTRITFNDDQIVIRAGNANMLQITEDDDDDIIFNGGVMNISQNDIIMNKNTTFMKDVTIRGNLLVIANESASPTYPLEVYGNSGGISAWFESNISVEDVIYHSSTFDVSKDPFDYIHSGEEYLTLSGDINYSKFYGYVQYEVPDKSKPVYINDTIENCHEELDKNLDETGKLICEERIITKVTYPYTKMEEGISSEDELDVLRQAVYELKIENDNLKARVEALEKK